MSKPPAASKHGAPGHENADGITLTPARNKTVALRVEAHEELSDLWRLFTTQSLVLTDAERKLLNVYAENAATYSLGAIVHLAVRCLRADLDARAAAAQDAP